jgi:serine/threonine protein kinase
MGEVARPFGRYVASMEVNKIGVMCRVRETPWSSVQSRIDCMADELFKEFPTRGDVARLSTEELADRLLMSVAGDSLNRHSFLQEVQKQYASDVDVSKAYLAAWAQLATRGYLVEMAQPGWFFLSPAGERQQLKLRQAPPALVPHRVIGARWIVEEELSSGGQGVTSVVRDDRGSRDERFVLKELRSTNAQARRRFAEETRALTALDHPNILRIVDFDADATPPWFVSEYCAGHGLDRAAISDLSVEARLQIFLDVCAALAAAHQKGITHRDIKPENVLLQSSWGPAVLGDFGICWFRDAEDERLTEVHEDIGSSFCRAPELFDGPLSEVKASSDVYCLGKLLYWLVVGKGGRAGRLRAEEFERGEKNLRVIFDDPRYEHINVVLRRMIVEDPALRFNDASEVLAESIRMVELFTKSYAPLAMAPRNCSFCGQGKYHENRRSAASSAEHALREDYRMFECESCGHTLFFRNNDVNAKW